MDSREYGMRNQQKGIRCQLCKKSLIVSIENGVFTTRGGLMLDASGNRFIDVCEGCWSEYECNECS